ncbi:MAG: D-alanyl-D-alanine carboxypeptidase/D-alanyl-D-alanine-endopeptidase, partial [Proteiniphilum sp.]|nr:D-alanyl-D-alanine carboxypeptidase/D-alanyl-D-alanine-endopeptidase [Proteiniphilum sp.]
MNKISLLSILSLFFSVSLFSQSALQQFVNNPALRHASIGVQVVDLKSGETIVSHDEQKSLTPASIAKVITTATALEVLGDDFRYETRVAIDSNNPNRILVIGSGDPTLASSVFETNPNAFFLNVASVAKRELNSDKEYEIVVVDNLFGYEGVSPEWTWIDLGNYYAAGSYGISVYDNSYKLFFDTTTPNATITRTEPEMKD